MSHARVLYRAQVNTQTLFSWVLGGLCYRENLFFDFLEVLHQVLDCVSPSAQSTKWPVQYQVLKANVFLGVLVAIAVLL